MNLIAWYEATAIGDAVRESTWVYPWVNSFHSVGMGFLVGVLTMIILRVLGVGKFSLAPLRRFVLVVQIAIGVNLVTGLMLFAGDAQRFYGSPTFRVKALLIVLGGILSWLMVRRVFGEGNTAEVSGEASSGSKAIAAAALACWFGAIFAGRLTAYLP
jgi:hypothetical protein